LPYETAFLPEALAAKHVIAAGCTSRRQYQPQAASAADGRVTRLFRVADDVLAAGGIGCQRRVLSAGTDGPFFRLGRTDVIASSLLVRHDVLAASRVRRQRRALVRTFHDSSRIDRPPVV
jgi:hypothetical protein